MYQPDNRCKGNKQEVQRQFVPFLFGNYCHVIDFRTCLDWIHNFKNLVFVIIRV